MMHISYIYFALVFLLAVYISMMSVNCAASHEVRQAYKQFVAAVVELMGGEVVSEEFQEVALKIYGMFGGATDAEQEEGPKRFFAKK